MTTIEQPRMCEILPCDREAIRQFVVGPGAAAWLCEIHYDEFEEEAPEFNEQMIGDEPWDK